MDGLRTRELGIQLREQRERLGFDLDQVEAKTKIRKRYLIALEEGNWDVLPGEVYARGFVRSYADCIGLEGRALLEEYRTVSSTGVEGSVRKTESSPSSIQGNGHTRNHGTALPSAEELDSRANQRELHRSEVRQRTNANHRPMAVRVDNKRSGSGPRELKRDRAMARTKRQRGYASQILLVGGVLVVLVGGLWFTLHKPVATPTKRGPTSPQNLELHQTGHSSAQNNKTRAGGGSSGVKSAKHGTKHKSPTQNVKPTTSTTVVSAQPFQASTGYQTYDVSTTLPLTVQMSVTSPCWVSVSGDGKVLDGSEIIQPGTAKTWTGTSAITVFLGHVQGVSLTVNGQSLPLPATNHPVHVVLNKAAGSVKP